jgi:hypothetical protein
MELRRRTGGKRERERERERRKLKPNQVIDSGTNAFD